MPIQKILLKVIALAIFVIFTIAFIRDYSKPTADSGALALTFAEDTTAKPIPDSVNKKMLQRIMSTSKSIILVDEKPLPIYSFPKKKEDTARHKRTNASVFVIQDTVKTPLPPKQ